MLKAKVVVDFVCLVSWETTHTHCETVTDRADWRTLPRQGTDHHGTLSHGRWYRSCRRRPPAFPARMCNLTSSVPATAPVPSITALHHKSLRYIIPNVTTFGHLLSQICPSSVTFVHPTHGVELYGNISSPLYTVAILWPPCKILQGNPAVGILKARAVEQIERFWTCRRLSHKRCKTWPQVQLMTNRKWHVRNSLV